MRAAMVHALCAWTLAGAAASSMPQDAAHEPADRTASAAPQVGGVPCAQPPHLFDVVASYREGQRVEINLARAAIDCVRAHCDAGTDRACVVLMEWAVRGVGELVAPDLGEASRFARRACDLGSRSGCVAVETLQRPALTETELDDVREAVVRSRLPSRGTANATTERVPICLALGTLDDPVGQDPPPAFMERFRGVTEVKPRSWCVANLAGNRLSVGPVDTRVHNPYEPNRTVRTWVLYQRFEGGGAIGGVSVEQQAGGWKVSKGYDGTSGAAPPFPQADRTGDRERLGVLVRAFADAWNRRDYGAMVRLRGHRDRAPDWFELRLGSWDDAMSDTRLEPTVDTIAFDPQQGLGAQASLALQGTWTPTAGAVVPLDPWKHAGSVTQVRVRFQKTTAHWEPGEWQIRDVSPPWVDTRLFH